MNEQSEHNADALAWKQAREYLNELGRIPPTFTTPVRSLLVDRANSEPPSPASLFLVTRLLKSPTLKAIFYYLTLTLHGEKVSSSAYLSSSDLVRLYAPDEVAAVIACIFFYKKITYKANLGDNREWESITKQIAEDVEVGGHLGYAIPNIGVQKAVLAASLRPIILGVFYMQSSEKFRDYRRHLQLSNRKWDLSFEHEHWGCTSLELVGNALQMMGFGINSAHSYMQAFGDNPPQDPEFGEEAYEYMIAEEWINVLKNTGAAPDRMHLGQYYPTKKKMHKLLYEVTQIQEKGSRHDWIRRKKEDINPHSTPQLYQEFLMELQGPEEVEVFYKENLPSEILEELSEEDLKELANDNIDRS